MNNEAFKSVPLPGARLRCVHLEHLNRIQLTQCHTMPQRDNSNILEACSLDLCHNVVRYEHMIFPNTNRGARVDISNLMYFDRRAQTIGLFDVPHRLTARVIDTSSVLLFEVLSADGNTYASGDVYSFGIVIWEVLSRELPWADVTHPREVYIRVVLNELRPDIPAEAPSDLADIVRACWAGDPEARPTFGDVIKSMTPCDWSECQNHSPPRCSCRDGCFRGVPDVFASPTFSSGGSRAPITNICWRVCYALGFFATAMRHIVVVRPRLA